MCPQTCLEVSQLFLSKKSKNLTCLIWGLIVPWWVKPCGHFAIWLGSGPPFKTVLWFCTHVRWQGTVCPKSFRPPIPNSFPIKTCLKERIEYESNVHNTISHFRLLSSLLFVENTFVKKHEFMKIRTADDWWRWAHTTLISEAKVCCSAVIILTISWDGQ